MNTYIALFRNERNDSPRYKAIPIEASTESEALTEIQSVVPELQTNGWHREMQFGLPVCLPTNTFEPLQNAIQFVREHDLRALEGGIVKELMTADDPKNADTIGYVIEVDDGKKQRWIGSTVIAEAFEDAVDNPHPTLAAAWLDFMGYCKRTRNFDVAYTIKHVTKSARPSAATA